MYIHISHLCLKIIRKKFIKNIENHLFIRKKSRLFLATLIPAKSFIFCKIHWKPIFAKLLLTFFPCAPHTKCTSLSTRKGWTASLTLFNLSMSTGVDIRAYHIISCLGKQVWMTSEIADLVESNMDLHRTLTLLISVAIDRYVIVRTISKKGERDCGGI